MAQLISMLLNRLVEFILKSSYFKTKGSQLLGFGDMNKKLLKKLLKICESRQMYLSFHDF